MEPSGVAPRPAKVGHQPEASLAWAPVTATAKRRQRARRPWDWASKYAAVAGADALVYAEGNTGEPKSRGRPEWPGSWSRRGL